MEHSLQGKVALVTGGGVRVGRAIAETLAAAGADLAVHFHGSERGAQTTVNIARSMGCRAEAFHADLSDPAQIEPLIERVERQLGPLDALVNSAARFDRAPFLDTPVSILDQQWALNARAPFLLSQSAARRMVARGSGDIVNIVDIGGARVAWRQYAAYCMTKAALASLTACLALELAPAVRVNAIAPGTVLPPTTLDAETLAALRERIPQHRFGSPQDIADAVIFFLAGPRFITGQILVVDGGRTLSNAGP